MGKGGKGTGGKEGKGDRRVIDKFSLSICISYSWGSPIRLQAVVFGFERKKGLSC